MAAFRETYANLHELRSLAPKVKIIALTATATALTRKTIMDVLLIKNPYTNVTYSVQYIPNDKTIEDYFKWLSDDLVTQQTSFPRTIIYCQTIRQCGLIYSSLKAMLGDMIYVGESKNPRNVIIEMLHSCSPQANKEMVLTGISTRRFRIKSFSSNYCFWNGYRL